MPKAEGFDKFASSFPLSPKVSFTANIFCSIKYSGISARFEQQQRSKRCIRLQWEVLSMSYSNQHRSLLTNVRYTAPDHTSRYALNYPQFISSIPTELKLLTWPLCRHADVRQKTTNRFYLETKKELKSYNYRNIVGIFTKFLLTPPQNLRCLFNRYRTLIQETLLKVV